MKKSKLLFVSINIILLMGYFMYLIVNKENTLSKGKLLLLELAPVDPRSLMQGDYMVLNYAINNNMPANIPEKGYVVFERDNLDSFCVVEFSKQLKPTLEQQIIIKYILKNQRIQIGAESFFFEEGEAEKYENAKFGGLKVDDKGNSVLVGLYDENKNLIK